MAKINPTGQKKSSSLFSSTTSTNWIPAKNAERERTRVRSLRNAFKTLQSCLPSVPPDTKLSKLDILILATNYITILMQTLDGVSAAHNDHHYHQNGDCSSMVIASESDPIKKSNAKVFRPIKKWPMRSRLYSMIQLEHSDVNLNKQALI